MPSKKNRRQADEDGEAESRTVEVQAVALKLPQFWPQQPEVWFAQAESQFRIRNIVADDTKYHHTVAALDQETAGRIIDLLKSPQQQTNSMPSRIASCPPLSSLNSNGQEPS